MEVLLIIFAIVFLILWLTTRQKLKANVTMLNLQLWSAKDENTKLKAQIADVENKNEYLTGKNQDLHNTNQELAKYQDIVDVQRKIDELWYEAGKNISQLLDEAKREVQEARFKAKDIKLKATNDAARYTREAEALFNNVTAEAKVIIANANANAHEIAGDAYYALKHSQELEKTVKAIKNVIEGYGDAYLIPTFNLLDDLASEFGHKEGGEKLAFSREKTRLMQKNGLAAQCDYAEKNRKETAINFILDAFNGKVDSILSQVKKDNFGTLEQKIKDAYQIVNNNGAAFRNAVITPEYLAARLEELKWAVITQELKWEEQEEQRRIKEQIREEEKARREFEKAIRDAQKEEDTLKRLIEKAQQQIGQATDAQKSMYEEKLRELEEKLKFAEDKNQRALSMAQQTRSGNVYVISNIGSFGENVYKIGMTRRLEPLDRIRELGDASVPFEFDVHALIYSDDAPKLERELHKKFLRLQINKINPRKEFFKVQLADVVAEVEKMEIPAKWTMVAEARHYRESLVIEEEIANDVQKRLEWERYQKVAEDVIEEIEEIETI